MRKFLVVLLVALLAGALFFSITFLAHAQIVPAQNQQIVSPYGGFIVATSSAATSKLSATSTPYFANFFAGNGTIGNLTVSGTCTGCGYWSRNAGLGAIYPTTLTDKVGIGTTTPNASLHIAGAASNVLAGEFGPGGTYGVISFAQQISPVDYALAGDGTNVLFNVNSFGVTQWRVNNSTKMTLNGLGWLSIGGDFSAAAPLDVKGRIHGNADIVIDKAASPFLNSSDSAFISQGDYTTGSVLAVNAAGTKAISLDVSGTLATIHTDYLSGGDNNLHIATYTDKNTSTGFTIAPGGLTNLAGGFPTLNIEGPAGSGSGSLTFKQSGLYIGIVDNSKRISDGTVYDFEFGNLADTGGVALVTSPSGTTQPNAYLYDGNFYVGGNLTSGLSNAVLRVLKGGDVGVGTTTPWKELSVGTSNTGTFAISTSTAGCAQFSSFGELYSTGTNCGSGGGGISIGDPVSGSTNTAVLYVDGSGNLANDSSFTYAGSGGVNLSAISFPSGDEITGGASGNFVFISAQQATLNSALLTAGRTFLFPDADGTLALGTGTTGNCATWSSANVLSDTGSPCGSGGGGVTNIATTYPVLGGPITTTGTLSLAFGTTTANTWGPQQTFGGLFATNASSTNATTTSFGINSETFTDLTGTGLSNVAGVLTNSGVLSIAQSAGTAQTGAITLATSTTAINNDWGITNSSGTFTFKIPTATASVRGLLSGTDWSTFNAKQAAISATWPITLTGATVGFNGLSTSTPAVVGNIPYFSGVNTFANVATSSLAVGTGLTNSGTLGSQIGGSNASISFAAIAANSLWANATGGSAVPTAIATSTLGIAISDTTGTLTVARGGTGKATFTSSQLLYGNGTNALSSVATTSETCTSPLSCTAHDVLTGGGAISLGTVPIANGGTATTTMYNGGVTFYNSTLGTLSQGTLAADFFYDLTNKRLGLSDATPDYRIEGVGSTGSGYFGLTNSTDGDIFSVGTTGLVGIGSTTPYALLGINAPAGTAPYLSIGSSTAEVFKILPSNSPFLGVGTTTPWRTLAVTGTVGFDGLTGSSGLQTGILCLSANKEVINESVACVASAKRYKENIGDLSVGLDTLMKLRPVSFTWKKDYLGNNTDDPNQNGIQYSLIADEVQKIDPHLVSLTTSDTTFEGKTYPAGSVNGLADMNHWVALLVKSIQEVATKNDLQDVQIAELQAEVQSLKDGRVGMCRL